MSTISAIGSSASAWPAMGSPGRMKEKLFAKVDADGSGSVDKTELQGLLDKVAGKSGAAASNAEDLFSSIDSNGDGSLDADELDQGMKSLMPPPSDTLAFAQSRGAVDGARPPPPPSGSCSDDSSGASTTTDPLDTNEDGTVSAQERAAGELAEVMKTLTKAMDSDGDQKVSSSERDSFVKLLQQYERTAANLSTQDSNASLSVAA
jgi:EF-hand domain pair